MRWIKTIGLMTGAALALQGVSALEQVQAQQGRNIYADPSNLQVLPRDISTEDLRQTMRAMSLGTGIRCASCHVGEEGQSMLEYDFAADVKERKSIARGMLKMVATINEQVAAIRADAGYKLTEVRCVTCHRGKSRPRLIGETLDIAHTMGGAEAVVAKYNQIREKYYGSHAYDFTPGTLNTYAGELYDRDPAAALALLEVSRGHNPGDAMTLVTIGAVHRAEGNIGLALENYRKARELNPKLGFLNGIIQKLEAAAAEPGD